MPRIHDDEYAQFPRLHDAFVDGFEAGVDHATGEEAMRHELHSWCDTPQYRDQLVKLLSAELGVSIDSEQSSFIDALFAADVDQLRKVRAAIQEWRDNMVAIAVAIGARTAAVAERMADLLDTAPPKRPSN